MEDALNSFTVAIGLDYPTLKYIHIIGATLLFGTGLGTAFQMYFAHRSGDIRTIVVVSRNTVIADWLFTMPAVIIQPVTGVLLAVSMGLPLTSDWLLLSVALYLLTGACWLPVVWLQIRMHALARDALAAEAPLPALYYKFARAWFLLGWPAFAAVLAIFYLMIFKPL